MARQKRGAEKATAEKSQTQKNSYVDLLRSGVTVFCLVVAAVIAYKGYLETRVNTRFDKEKMVEKSGLEVPERYWGSYRPGLYFGMKTRDPHSLVAGLMWYFPRRLGVDGSGIRHWCEQSDNLDGYGWIEHDGRNFGVQVINDGPHRLETSFVKKLGGSYGGDWSARISVTGGNSSQNDEVALIFYVALDEKTEGWISTYDQVDYPIPEIIGRTRGLGHFHVSIVNQGGEIVDKSYLRIAAPGLNVLKETVMNSMRVVMDRKNSRRKFVLPGDVVRTAEGVELEQNFIAVQVTVKVPAELMFVFESDSYHDRPYRLIGDKYEKELEGHRDAFHRKFENIFKLKTKNFDDDQISFAKAALSNLIGGIGYFYGASRVQSTYTDTPVPYWKAPLYTAVPSRSFFPRGFLWDEGFHGLVFAAWDLDIEIDIIQHWFDLINVEGWIPREQILGQEALAKVPEAFVTQQNVNANPPAFFLTINFILENHGDRLAKEHKLRFLDRLYPRLQAWFDWFNNTQKGNQSGTYRWRGRDPNAIRELNPKTLTSGLDDYPRASHPNDGERHLDLRCWIALAASVMDKTSQALGRVSHGYDNTYQYLTDPVLMKKLHWSGKARRFADYGLHTDSVALKMTQNQERIRFVMREPTNRLVDSTFGYVSLFPFLLHQLDRDCPELGFLLEDLENPRLLWTNYGLRSLSKDSPLYMRRNTEHDPPYWRGPVWMNINYLAVRALNHYARLEGPYSERARELYGKLRDNLIGNVYREYKRTGYVWEQYNDETGRGQGSRPFTGWSSLVVLLMGEIY